MLKATATLKDLIHRGVYEKSEGGRKEEENLKESKKRKKRKQEPPLNARILQIPISFALSKTCTMLSRDTLVHVKCIITSKPRRTRPWQIPRVLEKKKEKKRKERRGKKRKEERRSEKEKKEEEREEEKRKEKD